MNMKPRKIGLVSEFFYPHLGGVTEHLYFYGKELVRRGFEVVILTGHQGKEIDVEIPAGMRVIQIARSLPIFTNGAIGKISAGWNIGKKVQKILEEEKFDILHIHNPIDPVLPLLFLKYTNTITVGTFHTYFKSVPYFKIFQKIAQNYLDKLHGVATVSECCAEAMNRYFTTNFKVLPNGVDTHFFANHSGKVREHAGNSSNIFFLGRLDPRNDLDTLIRSLPHVLDQVPEARLLVAGDGPLRPYYERLAGQLLHKKIFFIGEVNGNRPNYFATSSVFCYPAVIASFGIALIESMSAGVPVVACNNEGFRSIIRHGVNGLLVEPSHPRKLAEAIIRVLKDKKLAESLSEEGRKTAEQYSWSRVADQVLGYYNEIYLREKGAPFCHSAPTSP